ncbi:hypothetical protein JQC72_09950 [Polycladomyces sp. WAk]|uniref:Uncharacterized protein n=1 Tax=Polycladomyces zharkentensis TaxID=2807616 RepID=A0ABS2WK50_9BACL|nr:hypothetical protein [Polycladomyces sp. WAk]MBN2909846.1 hypothetical protein [Polycladomyces sp. WAk]
MEEAHGRAVMIRATPERMDSEGRLYRSGVLGQSIYTGVFISGYDPVPR